VVDERVERVSLSSQIVERLRSDIVHGRVPPGTRLVQDELCARFGTSRMPVRDALRQLTHEGLLVENGGQREVTTLGASDQAEVHRLIAVLHGYAAGCVAREASDQELRMLGERWAEARAIEDPEAYGRATWDLHVLINQLAGSRRLVAAIDALQRTIPRMLPIEFPDEVDSTKLRYDALVGAIVARRADAAEMLVRKFAEDMTELLIRTVGHPEGDNSATIGNDSVPRSDAHPREWLQ
jgi:DNA-binding GntR family transcriptional regulator